VFVSPDQPAVVTGRIGEATDLDFFRINAAVGSTISFSNTSNVFPFVLARSPFELDDFFFAGDNIFITADVEYFLGVSAPLDGTPAGNYAITVRSVVTDGRHDSFETAARAEDPVGDDAEAIAQGSTDQSFVITGSLDTVGDLDFFTFIAPFTGDVTISAPMGVGDRNSSSLNFDVSVFDAFEFSDGTFGAPFLIVTDTNGSAVRSSNGQSLTVFQGDRYFVSVTNQGLTTGDYQLDLVPLVDDFPNDFSNAFPITLDLNNRGALPQAGHPIPQLENIL